MILIIIAFCISYIIFAPLAIAPVLLVGYAIAWRNKQKEDDVWED